MTQIKPFIMETLSNRLFDSSLDKERLLHIFNIFKDTFIHSQDRHDECDEYAIKYMRRMIYKETIGLGEAERRYQCAYMIYILCKVLEEQK